MVALPRTKMTIGEYLAWTQAQGEGRFELVAGEVVMMSPETVRHVQVKNEVWLALRNAIAKAGVPCNAFGDGVGIRIDETTVREPDATIQCKPADPGSLLLDQPLVVVEVVSPSSAGSDTGEKLAEYFSLESVRHYLIVDPVKRLVIHHARGQEPGHIDTAILSQGVLQLDPPGIVVAVAAFFDEGEG